MPEKRAKKYCKSKDFHMENISFILLVTNTRTRCVNSAKSQEKQEKHFSGIECKKQIQYGVWHHYLIAEI